MSLQNLVIIGGTILLAGGSIAYFTDNESKNSKYSRNSYYKESILLLNGYKPAVDNLGKPIKTAKINEKDQFNEFQEKNVKLKLPVYGKNRAGDLYIYATKASDEDRNWTVEKLGKH